MKYFIRWVVSGVIGINLVAVPIAYGLVVQPREFPELVQQADTIVVATVEGLRGAWSANGETIYTFVTLDELDVIKGDVPTTPYELRMPGGVVGDRAQSYPGMPNLELGQRYVLFIRGHLQELYPLVGVYQGLYRVVRDENEQQRVLRSDQPQNNSTRGVSSQQPTLNNFTARIRDQLMSDTNEGIQ